MVVAARNRKWTIKSKSYLPEPRTFQEKEKWSSQGSKDAVRKTHFGEGCTKRQEDGEDQKFVDVYIYRLSAVHVPEKQKSFHSDGKDEDAIIHVFRDFKIVMNQHIHKCWNAKEQEHGRMVPVFWSKFVVIMALNDFSYYSECDESYLQYGFDGHSG